MFTENTIALSELAADVDLKIERDCQIAYVAKVPNPLPNRLVACSERKHLREAEKEKDICGIITPPELAEHVPAHMGLAVHSAPLQISMQLHEKIALHENLQWAGFESQIDPSVEIHPSAVIDPRDVRIGAGTIIGPNAVVLERSVIGENCVIGPGAIIGCDAFQVFKAEGHQRVIRQSGGVKLGDRVEVQANCTLSRAVFGGFTELGNETILDSQVHVGHDCQIGKQVLIANNVSLSGRVVVEDNAYLAPNATISNGLKLAKGSKVTIGSAVFANTKPNEKVTGYFAQPHDKWMMQFIRSQRSK